MPEQTNPIKRLYDAIDKAISYGNNVYVVEHLDGLSDPAEVVWSMAMGINLESTEYELELLNSLTEIIRLVDLCENAVRQSTIVNQELHARQLGRVKELIFQIMGKNWGDIRSEFGEDFLMSLELSGEMLSTEWKEQEISADKLQELQTEIDLLRNRVLESHLDPVLTSALISGLEAMRRSILEYQIFGVEAIRQAVDLNIGTIVRYKDDFEGSQTGAGKEVVADFIKFIEKANATISFAKNIAALAAPVITPIAQWVGEIGD